MKGEFVDMAELLRGNLEAERMRAQSELEPGKSGTLAPNRREIPDFTSWVQCFALYASVVQSRFPEKGKDLWAYLGVIASEYRRVGGSGWRLYDAAFRQQFASMEVANFGTVDTTLLPPPSSRIGEVPRAVRGVCLLGVTMKSPVEGEG